MSSDYDPSDKATQMFFAETQNKLLFATTGNTAAELVLNRADASQPNMALTSWKGKVVRKQDITVAKNYLNADELDTLNRLVVIFLETAELRAKNKTDISMSFWKENVDKILVLNDRSILKDLGSISKLQMEKEVKEIYSDFDKNRKEFDARQADLLDLEELKRLIKKKK